MEFLANSIMQKIEKLPEGTPVSAKMLLGLGNRAGVDQALSRLYRRGHPGYPADESKFIQACLATKPASPTLTKTPSSATSNPELDSNDNVRADILATRKDGTKLPTVEALDGAFRMAGITSELSSMDQLDKDLFYIRAGHDLPSEFAEKYASQISDDKRTKLQILIKSGVSCSEP
jgi:hypothetical protein